MGNHTPGSVNRRQHRQKSTSSRAELPKEEPEEDAAAERDDAVNRVVVKYWWMRFGKPKDPDSWKGRNGVISFIRQKMGADAPKMESCRLTLQRLAEDETDDVSREMVAGSGKERLLSDEEDLYIGLLLVEGHSQRSATFILNGERSAQALPPVSLHVIRDAEQRIELMRRRRRSTKSGKSDLESAWAVGGCASATLVQGQMRRGAELAAAPIAGPTLQAQHARSGWQHPGEFWASRSMSTGRRSAGTSASSLASSTRTAGRQTSRAGPTSSRA
mmetsp:Transcript_28462/g.77057  ORF Transcript_28462/g.77057 Transcript_28462/m.77057 type:complete len:274 (+) Transcript_28462:136-957(+)